jgi:Ras-related protein Rab-5C
MPAPLPCTTRLVGEWDVLFRRLYATRSPTITPGNKADLETQRAVPTEEASAYAAENGLFFLETSAKTAANVNELFTDIAQKLPKVEPASAQPPAGGVVLTNATPAAARPRSSCC